MRFLRPLCRGIGKKMARAPTSLILRLSFSLCRRVDGCRKHLTGFGLCGRQTVRDVMDVDSVACKEILARFDYSDFLRLHLPWLLLLAELNPLSTEQKREQNGIRNPSA